MSDKTVLVTGATGLIGRVLVRHLLVAGYRVKAVARPGRSLPNGAERVEIADISEVSEAFWGDVLEAVDTVIHVAALVHQVGCDAKSSSEAYRRINTAATARLAKSAAMGGVKRFIFLSTIKVLGESSLPGRPFQALDKANPSDPYAESKWRAEEVIRDIAKSSNLAFVIIRPPLCYGPGVQANFQALMTLIKRRLPLPLGAVDNQRSLVSVYNLADLIEKCINHSGAINETFLVSDGADVSTAELIRRMGRTVNIRPLLLPVPQNWLFGIGRLLGKERVVRRLCGSLQVDLSHTQECLEWVPPISMLQGMQRTFRADDEALL